MAAAEETASKGEGALLQRLAVTRKAEIATEVARQVAAKLEVEREDAATQAVQATAAGPAPPVAKHRPPPRGSVGTVVPPHAYTAAAMVQTLVELQPGGSLEAHAAASGILAPTSKSQGCEVPFPCGVQVRCCGCHAPRPP